MTQAIRVRTVQSIEPTCIMIISMICDQKILVCRTPLEAAAVRVFSGKNLKISVVAVLVALKSLSAVNQFKLKGTKSVNRD